VNDLIIFLKEFAFLREIHVFIIGQCNGLIQEARSSINHYFNTVNLFDLIIVLRDGRESSQIQIINL
jgi:hypothetical protein